MLTNYESGQNRSVLDDPAHKCYVQKKGCAEKGRNSILVNVPLTITCLSIKLQQMVNNNMTSPRYRFNQLYSSTDIGIVLKMYLTCLIHHRDKWFIHK